MSNNDEFDIDEEEFAELLEKCELMFATKSEVYFDVHEFIDLIDCYMTQQEADKVTKLFSYAQKQHGSNSEIELRKALFDLARNYIDNAIQKLQQLLVVEPNNTEITINLSSAYIQNENPDTALHYLEQAIATNPDEEEEFAAFICPAFVAHGYCDIAQNILEKTLKKNPHNIELLYQLGLCYNTANNTEKSIELFKTILQSEPYSFDAWFGLGVAYWQREQFSEAIESLDYALAIDIDFIEAYFVKGACLANQNNNEAAIEVFEEIIKREPAHIDTLEALAECYTVLNDLEQAENYWQQILEVQPKNANAWAKFAHINALNGQYKQAIAMYQKAIELEPENSTILIDFSTMLNALDFNSEAIALCKKIIQLDKNNAEVWLKYSSIQRSNNNNNEALKILQQALEYVQDASIYCTLAELFVAQQKFDKALEYFEIAYTKDPGVADYFFDTCHLPTNQLELFHSIVHKKYDEF